LSFIARDDNKIDKRDFYVYYVSMKSTNLLAIFLFFAFASLSVSSGGMMGKPTAQSEYDLGLSFFNRGHYEEAISHFERATEIQPEFGKAYLYLGRSYLNLSRWKEAISPLRTAFRLSPEESREQIADMIMDVLLLKASELDPDEASQMEDIFRRQ